MYVVYAHMCMWYIHTCEHVHGGLRKASGILLSHSLPSSLETRSRTEPGASLVDGKPCGFPCGESCLYSPQHWGCRHVQFLFQFLRFLGSGLRLSCLSNQDSYPLHHLPSTIAIPLSLLFLLSPKIKTKTNEKAEHGFS